MSFCSHDRLRSWGLRAGGSGVFRDCGRCRCSASSAVSWRSVVCAAGAAGADQQLWIVGRVRLRRLAHELALERVVGVNVLPQELGFRLLNESVVENPPFLRAGKLNDVAVTGHVDGCWRALVRWFSCLVVTVASDLCMRLLGNLSEPGS